MTKLKMLKTMKFGAIAGLLALAGLAVHAQGPHGMRGSHHADGPGFGMMGGHAERMLDLVDATDAQRSQIKQIMDTAKAELKSQHADGKRLREQGMVLFSAPVIDAAAIEALRVQMQQHQDAASKRMSQAMVDAARVLSPEQRAKLAERMKKMQARMAERMSERGPGRGEGKGGKGDQ